MDEVALSGVALRGVSAVEVWCIMWQLATRFAESCAWRRAGKANLRSVCAIAQAAVAPRIIAVFIPRPA